MTLLLCWGMFGAFRLSFPLSLTRHLIGVHVDIRDFFAEMSIVRENMLALRHPYASSNRLLYPGGFPLQFAFDGAFAGLIGGALSIAIPLVAAYNLVVLLIAVVNVCVSAWYFSCISRRIHPHDRWLNHLVKSGCAALVFGLSPYVAARLTGHLNLAFIAGFPVLAWALVAAYTRRGNDVDVHTSLRACAVAVLLLALGSLQYLVFACIYLLPFLLVIRPRHLRSAVRMFNADPAARRLTCGIVGCCAALFVYLFHGYLVAILTGIIITAPSSGAQAPDLIDLFVPTAYFGRMWLAVSSDVDAMGKAAFLGTAAMAMAIAVLCWASGWRWRLLYVLYTCYLFSLLLGWLHIPYARLAIRPDEEGRYVVGILLLIASGFVLLPRVPRWLMIAILLLSIGDKGALRLRDRTSLPFPALAAAHDAKGVGIVSMPFDHWRGNMLPYFSDKKLVGGHIHYNGDIPGLRAFESALPDDLFDCKGGRADVPALRSALERLRSVDARTIFVWKNVCFAAEETAEQMRQAGLVTAVFEDDNAMVLTVR